MAGVATMLLGLPAAIWYGQELFRSPPAVETSKSVIETMEEVNDEHGSILKEADDEM